MEEQNLKLVDKLAQVIGESGAAITAHYAEWFIWSSIAWMVVGVALGGGAAGTAPWQANAPTRATPDRTANARPFLMFIFIPRNC